MTYGVIAAHKTTHPNVKPSVDIGASASGDSKPESDVLPRGLFEAFASNGREVVMTADGNDTIPVAFGETKASTDACCTVARRAKRRAFDCILKLNNRIINIWKQRCSDAFAFSAPFHVVLPPRSKMKARSTHCQARCTMHWIKKARQNLKNLQVQVTVT